MSVTGPRTGPSFSSQMYGNQCANRAAHVPGRCRMLKGSHTYPTGFGEAASTWPTQPVPERCEPVTRMLCTGAVSREGGAVRVDTPGYRADTRMGMATLSQLIARHAGVKQRAVVPAYRAVARANVFLPGP